MHSDLCTVVWKSEAGARSVRILAEIEKTAGLDAKHVQCRWSVYVPSYNNTSKQANAFPLKGSMLFKVEYLLLLLF